MKRHLAILLAILMVLGIAAVATAGTVESKGDTKITLGGDIRVRGEYADNDDDFNKATSRRRAAFDQRVRIYMDAQLSKNTSGRIVLENDNGLDNPANDGSPWGQVQSDTAGIYRKGNARLGQMYVLEAWLQHKFDMGLTLKAGHMPLILGRGLFLNHTKFGDDAIMLSYAPTKELNLALIYAKLSEGGADPANRQTVAGDNRRATDADLYSLITTYQASKDMKFGLNVSYLKDNDDRINTLSFPTLILTNADNILADNIRHPKLELWNVGLNTDLAFGPVSVYGDLNVQSGKFKNLNRRLLGGGLGYSPIYSMSLKGWAMLIGMAYDMKPFKLRMEYAYGSGDSNDNATQIPDGASSKSFITLLSNAQKYTYVYDFRTRTAAGAQNTGITNTNYLRLGVDYAATKDLSFKFDYYWLRASKKVAMPGIGGCAQLPNGNCAVSNEIGHEFDIYMNYNITKGLRYYVEGGYLFAGKVYDMRGNGNNGAPANTNKSADDAWAIRHGIMLSF